MGKQFEDRVAGFIVGFGISLLAFALSDHYRYPAKQFICDVSGVVMTCKPK